MRVGIIGRGFGAKVVAPAFARAEGCEVVDVVSPRDERAVAALCARRDVDLISVHSPPFLHLEHVRRAVEARHAVLCDKPFGVDAAESARMCELAREAGVLGLLNFENRYDATRTRLRALIADGAIGSPEHVQFSMLLPITRTPLRRHGWLFDDALGGGWLRAMGSHLIDFSRWTFGEVVEATGQLRTAIPERPDSDGKPQCCTADDGFVAALRSERGVTTLIDSSSAAPVMLAPTLLVVGSLGALQSLGESRIVLHAEDGAKEVYAAEPGGNALFAAQCAWACVVRDAVRDGAAPAGAPTFADGLAWNEVMGRIRAPA